MDTKTWYGRKGSRPLTVSSEFLEAVDFFFSDLLHEKSVTKAEIKLMGYLIRKSFKLGEEGEKLVRIAATDWVREAGLNKGEVDKTLAKCEEKGWIAVDSTTKPVTLRLRMEGIRST
ncbi:hypothetical protein [Paludifilum halophilum]|nr:hypothetical protein [Paludifilum halophilum]